MKHTNITRTFLLVGLFLLCGLIFNSTESLATAYTVSTNDTFPAVADSDCTLREAIENINNQPVQINVDCPVADGINDTINIPTGTATLAQSLPVITESVAIIGAGMGQTTLNGNSQHSVFSTIFDDDQTFGVSDLKITAWSTNSIRTNANGARSFTVERVELDGTDALDTGFGVDGIMFSNNTSATVNVKIHDVYIHSMYDDDDVSGIFIAGTSGGTQNIDIKRVTVANIETLTGNLQGILLLGGFGGDLSSTTFTGSVHNVTIENLSSGGNPVQGVSANIGIIDGVSQANLDFSYITIRNIRGEVGQFFPDIRSIAFQLSGAGLGPGGVVNINSTINNLVLSGSDGFDQNCLISDLSGTIGGAGAANITLSSGGNLSDDDTCASYFNAPTDQNNVANLGATLGALSNSGGYVPTIPLLAGSPAIDAGVSVAGVTTDARLVARPQGVAYDSGAYEYIAPTTVGTLASTGSNFNYLLAAAAFSVTMSGAVILKKYSS